MQILYFKNLGCVFLPLIPFLDFKDLREIRVEENKVLESAPFPIIVQA